MLHGVYTVLQVCMSTVRYVHVQFGAYICTFIIDHIAGKPLIHEQ
jgi:hypothetical protein